MKIFVFTNKFLTSIEAYDCYKLYITYKNYSK